MVLKREQFNLERIELRECHGIIGITTVMEILHAVRVGAMKRELHGQEEVSKAIDKLRNYGLDFVIPKRSRKALRARMQKKSHERKTKRLAVYSNLFCLSHSHAALRYLDEGAPHPLNEHSSKDK